MKFNESIGTLGDGLANIKCKTLARWRSGIPVKRQEKRKKPQRSLF